MEQYLVGTFTQDVLFLMIYVLLKFFHKRLYIDTHIHNFFSLRLSCSFCRASAIAISRVLWENLNKFHSYKLYRTLERQPPKNTSKHSQRTSNKYIVYFFFFFVLQRIKRTNLFTWDYYYFYCNIRFKCGIFHGGFGFFFCFGLRSVLIIAYATH